VIIDRPAGWLQERVGLALRNKVAGPDAPDRAAAIWGSTGTRWFTDADPIWRVHGDASMFPGGVAALLLQSLHPLAMAGVAGHSGFKGDPWGRLQRTSLYLATTTFGTVTDAERMIARVRGIHRQVKGEDFKGRPYSASDPELLRWVHVAEVFSFLAAYQAYAATPLTPAEADLYVVQTNFAASRLGATGLPTSVSDLHDQLAAFRPELESTPAAREAARFLLLNPPLSLLERPGYAALATGGIGVLPSWARTALRLPMLWPAPPLARGVGRIGTGLVRWGMAGLQDQRRSAVSTR
jgi:uncharacterized protein (DUF2236 family)